MFLFILLSCLLFVHGNKNRKLKVDNQTATIVFTGDISFDGPVKYFAEVEKTCNYKRPFDRVRDIMATADLRVGNLESPLLKEGYGEDPPDANKLIRHYGSIAAVEGLKYAGFDIVQVANNHFADFGIPGVKSTISALKKAGIAYVGLQDRVNKKTSQTPVIKTVNGLRIGFLSYCLNNEGCNPYRCEKGYCSGSAKEDDLFGLGPAAFDKRVARNDIRKLSMKVDFVILLMHWSQEYLLVPPLGMREIAQSLKGYGASIIIGSHPHVIQGHECQGTGGIAAYSLGNFLFPKHTKASIGQFLGGSKPKVDDVKAYVDMMQNAFSPSQFGLMLRIKLSRAGIVAADYLPVEIKNEPKTNCLKPTPASKEWIKFCGEADLYCIRLRDVCASEASAADAFDNKSSDQFCIKGED